MKGETLSENELGRLKPIRGEGGKTWRAFCPFHGSDKQRSLRVDRASGRFQCFACEAWGYMDWARESFKNQKASAKPLKEKPASASPRSRVLRPGAESSAAHSQTSLTPPLPSSATASPLSPQAATPSEGLLRALSIAPPPAPSVDPSSGSSASLSGPGKILPNIRSRGASFSPRDRPLADWLAEYQAALPSSMGEEYLADRKIPLALARSFGLGFAAPGRWAHRSKSGGSVRDWHFGRLVFPHTGPDGALLNLYGRALGDYVPKELRHDHLPGAKGYFNFPALTAAAASGGDLFVCEGPFDALSLLAAKADANASLCGEMPGASVSAAPAVQPVSPVGLSVVPPSDSLILPPATPPIAPPVLAPPSVFAPVIAIFGVQGWRHDWASAVKRVVFALDADSSGQRAWRTLARQLSLRGKQVRVLPPEALGGAKDLNEAWIAGSLQLD